LDAALRAPRGYRGTTLVRSLAREGLYIVTDRWRDAAAFEAFRFEHGKDYDALDAECEALTLAERSRWDGSPWWKPRPAAAPAAVAALAGRAGGGAPETGHGASAWGRDGPWPAWYVTADEDVDRVRCGGRPA
jgi:hypothetical protein